MSTLCTTTNRLFVYLFDVALRAGDWDALLFNLVSERCDESLLRKVAVVKIRASELQRRDEAKKSPTLLCGVGISSIRVGRLGLATVSE